MWKKTVIFITRFLLYALLAALVTSALTLNKALIPDQKFGEIIEGSIERPFAYRILVVIVVNTLEKYTPSKIKNAISNSPNNLDLFKTSMYDGSFDWDKYGYRFRLIYWINFLTLLTSFYIFRAISSLFTKNLMIIDFMPIIFGLLTNLIFAKFFKYYDFTNLMLSSLLIYLILKNHFYLSLPVYFLAILNKESAILIPFILMVPTYLTQKNPLLEFNKIVLFVITGLSSYLLMRMYIHSTKGSSVYDNLRINLRYYLNPLKYLKAWFPVVPAIKFPLLNNIILLAPSLAVLYSGFKHTTKFLQYWFLTVAAINIPMVILWGWPDEVRNLEYLFVPSYLLMSCALEYFYGNNSTSKNDLHTLT